jgi:membrane protein
MNLRATYDLLKETVNHWIEDKAMRMGAALAYYTAFSLTPILVISLGIVGLLFGRDEITRQIHETVGEPAGRAIDEMLKNTDQQGGGILATVFGLIALFVGATGVFGELQDSLNTVWKVEPKPGRGIWGMIRDRFLSFTMVLGVAFLLLVSLVVSSVLATLGALWTPESLPGGTYLWQAVNQLVSLAVVSLLFALMFKYLPDVKIAWRDVWIGAVLTAVLFTVGKYALGAYLGRSSVTSAYGAAGSLVLILLWVYYSALILLFGAEFTRVYANRYGFGVHPDENAQPISREALDRQGMPHAQKIEGDRDRTRR